MSDPDSRSIGYDELAHNCSQDGQGARKGTTERNQAQTRSWAAPATMLSAFMVGLGIMLAQHFTYTHLNGKAVSDISASQAWISRISTGLAFAIQVSLTISVGAAFIQHQWRRLHQEIFSVGEVDAVSGALGNLFNLLSSRVWLRHPVLAFMVVVAWTIPLSAVVTPGSLSVRPLRGVKSLQLQVPQPQYNFTNYATQQGGGSSSIFEISPHDSLTRLIVNTASSGTPVQLSSAFQNQTYKLAFQGPAVKCGSADMDLIYNASAHYGASGSGEIVHFASIVYNPANSSVGWPDEGYKFAFDTLDQGSQDAARIFVMTNTSPPSETLEVPDPYDGSPTPVYRVNVTECLLYNATYDVEFTFKYPNQTRSTQITWMNPVSAIEPDDPYDDWWHSSDKVDVLSYSAVMAAFGKLLVGYSSVNQYSIYTNEHTSWNVIKNIDWLTAETVQSGLEELFQNITLSLLSDDSLTKNSTVAEFIPVEVEAWPVSYVYRPLDLFLANGLSLLAALICAAIGLRAFFVNNTSYQNIFSTYLRAMNNTSLSRFIEDDDVGADPLPRAFSRVQVKLGERTCESTYVAGPNKEDSGSQALLAS